MITIGTVGKKIVNLDIKKLVGLLNKALADELLAYYQYWVGAKVVQGMMRKLVEAELIEHAKEELEHAEKLVDRIVQLGGTPILQPKEWYQYSNCGYEAPNNSDVVSLLKQNIKGEQCAIGVYNYLVKLTKDKDPITYHLVLDILEDEVEHEEDLEAILSDIKKAK